MADKMNLKINLDKTLEYIPFLSLQSTYKSMDSDYASIYLDYSMCSIPYQSIKESYACLEAYNQSLFLDYTKIITPYDCLIIGFDSVIRK